MPGRIAPYHLLKKERVVENDVSQRAQLSRRMVKQSSGEMRLLTAAGWVRLATTLISPECVSHERRIGAVSSNRRHRLHPN